MKRTAFAAALVGLGLFAAVSGASGAPEPKTPPPQASEVRIENFTFKPETLSVRAGTIVTFTNADDIPHSIVAADGSFHSKALDTGDAFTYTFTKPGDVSFFCGLHPHMQGHIIVIAQ